MRFLSLFDGIGAASVAWEPLGWECVGVSEIEAFPIAVTAHHRPHVPQLGDVTKITEQQIAALGQVDLIVGGFPCQDLSVAGKRAGLKNDDGTHTRSGLFFDAMRIVQWARKHCGLRWLLIENVPGLFSSNRGRDFAAVVGAMVGAGFDVPRDGWRNAGVAVGPDGKCEWSTLDAQFFNVAQRRVRVFALADFGDWRRAAAVLFEPASLRGDPAPGREAREGAAARALCSTNGGIDREDRHNLVTHSLRSEGFDASEDGAGRGIPLTVGALTDGAHNGGGLNGQDAYTGRIIPVQVADSLRTRRPGEGGIAVDDTHLVLSPALNTKSGGNHAPDTNAYVPVRFAQNQRDEVRMMDVAGALAAEPGAKQPTYAFHNRQDPDVSGDITHPLCAKDNGMGVGVGVRRLTPRECERLQGFPDDFTLVPYRNKPASDGPRYKALGNSMAVPVMNWIGRRIAMTTSDDDPALR